MLLRNQTILILGGSGQMGSATAHLAAQEGANLILAGRQITPLRSLSEQLVTKVQCEQIDIGDARQTEAFFGRLEPVDHMVIAVSANAHASSIPDTVPENAQAAFGKFWSTYYALYFGARKVRPTGSIVALSGSSARRPGKGFGVWTTIHGSIEALMRAAALELAPIRVNTVSPGGIGLKPDRQLVPRPGIADDIGLGIVSLLANPAVTGAVLDVDSGERLGSWSGS